MTKTKMTRFNTANHTPLIIEFQVEMLKSFCSQGPLFESGRLVKHNQYSKIEQQNVQELRCCYMHETICPPIKTRVRRYMLQKTLKLHLRHTCCQLTARKLAERRVKHKSLFPATGNFILRCETSS